MTPDSTLTDTGPLFAMVDPKNQSAKGFYHSAMKGSVAETPSETAFWICSPMDGSSGAECSLDSGIQ